MKKIDTLTQLAQTYIELAKANNITTGYALSQLTYSLRESSDKGLIYLSILTKTKDNNYTLTPSPIASQKEWSWVKNQDILDSKKHPEGYVTLWVEQDAEKTTILVKQSIWVNGERQKNILFSQTL